jgi:hypothetical protein
MLRERWEASFYWRGRGTWAGARNLGFVLVVVVVVNRNRSGSGAPWVFFEGNYTLPQTGSITNYDDEDEDDYRAG